MVSSEKKLANVVGGKSARACDNCVKKRARWYCTADDAFLCQSCDSKVHSANPLARRHERVRLKTVSSVKTFSDGLRISVPSWQKGFTRKARTPRKNKNAKYVAADNETALGTRVGIVPEISGDDENDEQLLYRVPIFDPFVAELCSTSVNSDEGGSNSRNDGESTPGSGYGSQPGYNECGEGMGHVIEGFVPSEMDLAEFAADVESLLGKGLEDHESFDIESLGILGEDEREIRLKVEDDDVNVNVIDGEYIGGGRECLELMNYLEYDDSPNNNNHNNSIDGEEEEEEDSKEMAICVRNLEESKKEGKNQNILLRLDYEGVMSAWDHQRSPWTTSTGERPRFNPNDYWSDFELQLQLQGMCAYGETEGQACGDGEREARVLRYREKRRTRLFSKKIRYEVRKLNAEKRPRMKGRFVKRSPNPVLSTA